MGNFKVRVSLPRNSWNQDQADILMHATQFYAKNILGARLANLCKVNIKVRKSILDVNTFGECEMIVTGSKRQRKFEIVLNDKRDIHEKLETLAHEMIHVKQKAKDELRYSWNNKSCKIMIKWKDNAPVESNQIPYRERPWEIEARQFQRKYYRDYIDHVYQIKNKVQESTITKS
jgi:hypothetical protein